MQCVIKINSKSNFKWTTPLKQMVTKLENFIVYNSGSRSGDFSCKTRRALANTLWERLVYNSLANTGEFVGSHQVVTLMSRHISPFKLFSVKHFLKQKLSSDWGDYELTLVFFWLRAASLRSWGLPWVKRMSPLGSVVRKSKEMDPIRLVFHLGRLI